MNKYKSNLSEKCTLNIKSSPSVRVQDEWERQYYVLNMMLHCAESL